MDKKNMDNLNAEAQRHREKSPRLCASAFKCIKKIFK
jgi:hypothetical protein